MSEGARERRKRETRAALHRAALEIAHAEGLAAATVERITERAGVSPRTFFNYFATKEDALAGLNPEVPDQLAAALLARPDDEPLAEALRVVLTEQMQAVSDQSDLWQMRRDLAAHSSTLSAAVLGSGVTSSRALAAAAYERTGTSPAEDPCPALAVFGAVGALRAAMWLYGERGGTGRIDDVVGEAFAAAAGVSSPRR